MGDKINKTLKDWKVGAACQRQSATISRKRGRNDE